MTHKNEKGQEQWLCCCQGFVLLEEVILITLLWNAVTPPGYARRKVLGKTAPNFCMCPEPSHYLQFCCARPAVAQG